MMISKEWNQMIDCMLHIMRIQKGIWLFDSPFHMKLFDWRPQCHLNFCPRPPSTRTLQRRSTPQRQVLSNLIHILFPFLKPAFRNLLFLLIKSNWYPARRETLSFGLDQDLF